MKKPRIYYKEENPLEISFDKQPGYKKVTSNSPVAFECLIFDTPELLRGFMLGLAATQEPYCTCWDLKACAIAYTDKNFESQLWHDLRTKKK